MTQSFSIEGRFIKLRASIPSLSSETDLSLPFDFTDPHPVHYQLQTLSLQHELPEEQIITQVDLNHYIGQSISIEYLGKISCIYCGRKTKKPYGDGLCYPCFMEQPTAAECIIRPALCRAHLGEGRDPLWEKEHHLQPHYVYLVLSSKYKVGVTRDWPTRWLDQGADEVKVIAKTPYRQLAGIIELELSQYYSDKLAWQSMLKGLILPHGNLETEAIRIVDLLPPDLRQYCTPHSGILKLHYPKVDTPKKVKSQKLDKVGSISGTLLGIKGQYLIFDEDRVINIRRHSGFHARICID